MLSRKITIKNPSGLHLRPAGVLSQTAMKFKSDIIIEYGENEELEAFLDDHMNGIEKIA